MNKTMFKIPYASSAIGTVVEVVVVKETAYSYFVAAGVRDYTKRIPKTKASKCLFPTFEEAKAALVEKRRRQIEYAELAVEGAQQRLAEAQALTAPAIRIGEFGYD